jgi:oxaloacetate decarboxylase alpha subunit
MGKVYITDTILRDAHQSQAATRMKTSEMLPAAGMLNDAGYWSLEMWGGATFDSCLRFLYEDPWERLRQLRAAMPDMRMQMLLRGQNLLGYRHYPDDVVDLFVQKAIENGIDVVRIFDALNDTRNMRRAMEATKRFGGHCEAAISYTTSPVHTREYFVNLAAELETMGADTICIKDMANLLLPYEAYALVSEIKKAVKAPIHVHTHNKSGTGDMTYLKAIEAGAGIVDCALSSMANGTAQPCTESLVATLHGTEYDTGMDITLLNKIADYFAGVSRRLMTEGFLKLDVLGVDIKTLIYQVPGGMYSNMLEQLEKQGALDKLTAVLEEVPRVREDFGYPPLVTPTSQIVGTQAVLNVVAGERYKMVTRESKALLRGEYGRLPGDVNEDVRKKCIGDVPLITHRPADDLAPELEKHREEIREYTEQEEDVLSYALFPPVATKFFEFRRAQKYGVDSSTLDKKNMIHPA